MSQGPDSAEFKGKKHEMIENCLTIPSLQNDSTERDLWLSAQVAVRYLWKYFQLGMGDSEWKCATLPPPVGFRRQGWEHDLSCGV